MQSGKLNLTTRDILDKEFKTGIRGYNQEEVDKFLDLIIKDYELLSKEIELLKKENERLKKSTDEPAVTKPAAAPFTNTNPDILRRLSNLEKHVFGSKLYE
ncbi:cell division regulator GpsB [Priestia taiwanensis]|uniref:Cell cycle protein GpsB n=1 Tax=Priestia taiwanensis TaxID=1347902 RepID=A0A917EKX0_9BACI|nr:cell division regulator GpsB [Priestia taiwanensis]MBM7361749.1 DivIVA domain-containing protein [Priestia taiwanensis]GGE56687.1 cell cycle protein GpsB [Priestia taiwanensis]